MSWTRFTDELPKPDTWVKCLIDGEEGNDGEFWGVTEWAYCVGGSKNTAIFSDGPDNKYCFVHQKESYTHWLKR